jgi:flagellar protein FlaJ
MKTIAVQLFGWLADRTQHTFSGLRDALVKADINIILRTYLSLIYFISFFSFLFTSIFVFSYTTALQYEFSKKIFLSLGLGGLAAFIAFVGGMIYPSIKAQSRRKSIETNLPFAIVHMAAAASSGLPPSTMFRLLVGFKEYGEVSTEARKIVRNIDVFGLDITTAIREVAKKTPSTSFREFLEGVATTIDTGGDLYTYLQQQADRAMFEYRIRREKYLQTLSTYADFYTAVLIAAPLFLVAVLTVMSMIEGNVWGLSIPDVMRLGIFVLIPLVNTLFLLFLHLTQPEL